ncbi:MAG: His/Gly/Thr/Pro-type tRNA ligase C-terminal domain-containing protein, partial [Nitrosopumilaceae archaeon]|nr:His/Gly/Thr/Pro-type tRNA ligase C-terminal domain-containing protein [Nitrosopumilaceae archaeon]
LRAFTMPDCHAFCAGMTQAIEELQTRFDLSKDVIRDLGINDTDYEMAIRFTEDFYNENKSVIEGLVKKHGKPVLVELWKEKFFYFVLKWEFNYIDNMGKASALSTDQIDVENGKRYGIEFVDESNKDQNPIILHNSPSGAIERVIYALLENAAKDTQEGKKAILPLWLAPTQVRIIPIKEEFVDYCNNLADKLDEHSIRVDIDDRNESIGKRIREAEKEWIRFILVIGEKETNSETLSIRDRKLGDVRNLSLDDFVIEFQKETAGKPTSKLNLPRLVSKRPQIMV